MKKKKKKTVANSGIYIQQRCQHTQPAISRQHCNPLFHNSQNNKKKHKTTERQEDKNTDN